MAVHKSWLLPLAAFFISGCTTTAGDRGPIATVASVDLPRYMGTWYPIANIAPWPETNAYNSVEQYELDEDGNIPTVFTYNNKAPDGAKKTLKSKAFVQDKKTNATWGVQFFWPIKAEYLIAWLAPDYSQAIVARNKRDYVWYMARTPQVSEADYQAAVKRIADFGYDISTLQRVPRNQP